MRIARAFFFISSAVATTKLVEQCLAAIANDLSGCDKDDVECQCNVLATSGAQCLANAPPEAFIELVSTYEDGQCLQYDVKSRTATDARALSNPHEWPAVALRREDQKDVNLGSEILKWANSSTGNTSVADISPKMDVLFQGVAFYVAGAVAMVVGAEYTGSLVLSLFDRLY